MSYSYTEGKGDGVTKVFSFKFTGHDYGYFRESDIHVFVDGNEAPFKLTGSNQVELVSAPKDKARILIRRIMPKDLPYADWARGADFSELTVNNSFLQMLYAMQELYDGFMTSGFRFNEDLSMGGYRIIDLGNGVNDSDAVNIGQMKGWDTSALAAAIRAEDAAKIAVEAQVITDADKVSCDNDAIAAHASAVTSLEARDSSVAAKEIATTAAATAVQSAANAQVSENNAKHSEELAAQYAGQAGENGLPDKSVSRSKLSDAVGTMLDNSVQKRGDALILPQGAAEVGQDGDMRFNQKPEAFYNGKWRPVGSGGGATGGGENRAFYENEQRVTDDYTIPANTNSMSAGPRMTIDLGVTLKIPLGSSWVIVG